MPSWLRSGLFVEPDMLETPIIIDAVFLVDVAFEMGCQQVEGDCGR